jgi:hypothetical protein
MTFQALMSSVYLRSAGIGMYSILLGCSSVIIAGLISFWRIRLTPIDITLTSKGDAFKTYIAKRLVISIVTLIGVSFLIFLMVYRLRAAWEYLL